MHSSRGSARAQECQVFRADTTGRGGRGEPAGSPPVVEVRRQIGKNVDMCRCRCEPLPQPLAPDGYDTPSAENDRNTALVDVSDKSKRRNRLSKHFNCPSLKDFFSEEEIDEPDYVGIPQASG